MLTKLISGNIKEPVAIRRVHNQNRITKKSQKEMRNIKNKLLKSIKQWSTEKKISKRKLAFLYYSIFFYKNIDSYSEKNKIAKIIIRFISILKFSSQYSIYLGMFIIIHLLKKFLFKSLSKI